MRENCPNTEFFLFISKDTRIFYLVIVSYNLRARAYTEGAPILPFAMCEWEHKF